MIRSFKHKGLEKPYIKGSIAGIQPEQATRINDRLKGDKKELWAVNVSANWRIVFKFEDSDAYIVNYKNYH